MYEDLVKRLNAYSAEHECHGGITAEAADAIEELNLIAKSYERSAARWAETASKAIEQIPRWIPVTERLPEEYGRYLCRYRVEDGETIGYCTDFGRYDPVHGEWYAGTATHWMPLPEPPEEEE